MELISVDQNENTSELIFQRLLTEAVLSPETNGLNAITFNLPIGAFYKTDKARAKFMDIALSAFRKIYRHMQRGINTSSPGTVISITESEFVNKLKTDLEPLVANQHEHSKHLIDNALLNAPNAHALPSPAVACFYTVSFISHIEASGVQILQSIKLFTRDYEAEKNSGQNSPIYKSIDETAVDVNNHLH